MVDEVRRVTTGVVSIEDPHFLAEDALDREVDGGGEEEQGAQVEQTFIAHIAPVPLTLPTDEPEGGVIQRQLNAYVSGHAMVNTLKACERLDHGSP